MSHASVWDRIRNADAGRPFVVAQLGQSLDGRISAADGSSRWISGPAALRHLHALRAVVDAVVVGVGTVVTDNPRLTVRHVTENSPARIVIDPKGRMPKDASVLNNDGYPCIVIAATDDRSGPPDHCVLISVPKQNGKLDPKNIVTRLFEHGFKRLLIEGGARTLTDFINARAIDRLHVVIAPKILGNGQTGLNILQNQNISEALMPETEAHVLDDGNVLFDCDLSHQQWEPAP